jgi:TolB-like protein/cytochrome c-type biogenesis protein CcmH/NrfG
VIYRFGDHTLDTESFRLTANGEEIAVEPQVFSLLLYLVEHRDRVVSKDEIIEHVWDGRIVSDGTLTSRINSVRRAVRDDGKSQAVIKTFPRRGLRFVAAVTEDNVSEATLPLPDKPALAVLPFENLGGDPEQAYFADGLTEDIIHALSLWRSFPVIARHSTFVYRGEAVKIQEVGRELGARYVLEGSVRRADDRVRVTAQLIDADTGHHVWAERFDRQFEDIFDLQDDLTQKIAAIVAPELERVEDNRAKVNQPQNLDAWHLVQRGMALLNEYTKATNHRAREMFGEALKLDPTYSRAYSGLALAYARAMMSGYEESRETATDKTMVAARQAVALDSSDAYAHNMLGMACLWTRQFKDAISTFQRAVELNPSYGHARASLGDTLNRMGRTDEGIALMEDALRLNPDAPNLRHFNAFLARACINARRYEDAVEWARKAIHLRSDLAHAHCLMAVALAHLDRSDEARTALDECLRVQPDFFDSAVELTPFEDPAANEHLLDGLRKAGLPE